LIQSWFSITEIRITQKSDKSLILKSWFCVINHTRLWFFVQSSISRDHLTAALAVIADDTQLLIHTEKYGHHFKCQTKPNVKKEKKRKRRFISRYLI